MRLVCVDHYFDQDIGALQEASGANRCFSIDYEPFLELARRFFPDEVFTGIEAYFRPEHADARAAYRRAIDKELERLQAVYRFDALLAPSDTFFWIRALIEAAQTRGIPFVVLQKEATIPPGWLEGPAREWGETSPFIADHMLVSSEHHKAFWVNSGVRPEQITVTGQPRFDIYAQRGQSPVRSGEMPTVLFLTYDENAYLPIIDRTGLAPWRRMRDETEAALVDVARRGTARVFFKAHPQPAEDQTEHLAELAGKPGVEILDPRGDVRHYILDADVVVGFQTTALLESLAAGKPTVYTWWTNEVEHYEGDLIPFHREREALVVAESPRQLQDAIEQGVSPAPQDARALVTRYLGPIDGKAAERSWNELERLVAVAEPARVPARGLRAAAALASVIAAATWTAATVLTPLSYFGYRLLRRARGGTVLARPDFEEQLALRRGRAVQRLIAASTR